MRKMYIKYAARNGTHFSNVIAYKIYNNNNNNNNNNNMCVCEVNISRKRQQEE